MSNSWERTPIADSSLSIVVLKLDEDDQAVQRGLSGLNEEVKKLNRPAEILLPCTPAQAAFLQSLITAYPQARIIEDHAAAEGIGTELKVGIAAAIHPLVFTLPAGYQASVLPLFFKDIDLVDIVCGARKSRHKHWRWRQFFSVSYQLFGLWLPDLQCPVRLYRREIFTHIPIQSKGSFAQIEILAKASFQSKLLTEVEIDGPISEPTSHSGDFWEVLKNPDFGPPPEKIVETTTPLKPIISSQAPEPLNN